MFKKFSISSLLLMVLSFCADPLQAAGGWKFIWSEEFNKDGAPDNTTWTLSDAEYLVRDGRLDPSCAYCKGGSLILEGRRVGTTNNWITAGMVTQNKKVWTYGRFQMRGRVDIRAGSFPAWWAFNNNMGYNGEIDMMEYYAGKTLFNVIYTGGEVSKTMQVNDAWSKEFHVWTWDWDSTWIDLSIDGELKVHFNINTTNGLAGGLNPYRQPMMMLINMAIGSSGGSPANTTSPIRYETDWIRVWQRAASATACSVKVNGGSGSGVYVPGTQVTIGAKMPAPVVGQKFSKWVALSLSTVSIPRMRLSSCRRRT